MSKYDVCVMGLGYIGIPTAVIFANCGKKVLGVDIVKERVDKLNKGKCHIGEKDIDDMLESVVKIGNLQAEIKPISSSFYIVAVPTPFIKDGNRKLPDLSFVEGATRGIASVIENGQCVILESTSPVGTTQKMKLWLEDELKKIGRIDKIDYSTIMFAHCPERILPGQMLRELISNDRIVGGMDRETSEIVRDLYKSFCKGEIFITDDKTAEMTKLTENASRDVSIAFANELSVVCDKFEINVWELIKLANRHPRVNILNPGPGVGGHCIAVDPWFIVADAEEEAILMRTAREVNDAKPFWVLKKVYEACNNISGRKAKVACLGLTFKANINDMRESPALEIVEILAESKKCEIIVVEPKIEGLPKVLEGKVVKKNLNEAVAEADIVLLLVEHNEFSQIDKNLLSKKILLDTKGFFNGV